MGTLRPMLQSIIESLQQLHAETGDKTTVGIIDGNGDFKQLQGARVIQITGGEKVIILDY